MNEYFKNSDLCLCTCSSLNNDYIKGIAEKVIPFEESVDEKVHLLHFLQSIASVDISFLKYYWNVLDKATGEVCREEELLLERTFAYELYRQWQNRMELYNLSLRVDAEIGKKLSNDEIDFLKLKNIKGEFKEPDLVLHASQENTNNHTIICEIKRNVQLDSPKIIEDIIKICHYIDPNIWAGKPYKYGCFIVVNKEFSELDEHISKIKDRILYTIKENDLSPELSHILCIAYNGTSVKWEILSKLLNK